PSDEVSKAWKSLYRTTLTVPRSQAALLPNKTIPVNHDADAKYIIGLNAMHDLHCLDKIRRGLNYFYYKQWNSSVTPCNTPIDQLDHDHAPHGQLHLSHFSHCIDMIRQSLMCHADITPMVWQWSEEDKRVKLHVEVEHECRNFDAIRDWADEHYYAEGLDIHSQPDEVGGCKFGEKVCSP
ncbi:uncharacterized protein K452DRAFT_223373, partial [Aplosporella prunicola CBS 121167]